MKKCFFPSYIFFANFILFLGIMIGFMPGTHSYLEAAIHHRATHLSPEDCFLIGREAFEAKEWKKALKYLGLAAMSAPQTSFGQEAHYYRGIAFYNIEEFDSANRSFNAYLSGQTNPRFFYETMHYKFYIAEQFRGGACRRYFSMKPLPKWASGKYTALEIYDELAAAMPADDLGAKAHFYKGCVLRQTREYREAIESFQTVIQRFPKHELVPESYRFISAAYVEQSRKGFHDLDLITFAEMNLSRFRSAFPRDERVQEVEADVLLIKERHARGLFETGCFYERIKRPGAAVIYYTKAIRDFPDTHTAEMCRMKLSFFPSSSIDGLFQIEENLDNDSESLGEELLQGEASSLGEFFQLDENSLDDPSSDEISLEEISWLETSRDDFFQVP